MPRARLTVALVALLAAWPSLATALPRVRSMAELRREGVVRQGWDLSCGAAALATVLTFHLGDPVPEPAIVETLLRGADASKIRARGGFSLLDLKRYATARGYAAAGFGNLSVAQLEHLGVAIIPTLDRAGPHFMVFRGVDRGRALLADPSYGNRTVPLAELERLWSPRVAFVVRRPDAAGGDSGRPAALVPGRLVREAGGAR